jgi:DNA ligase-1
MKLFAELVKTIDSTTKTNAKVEALAHYFTTAHDQDKVWTIAILSHRRPKRPINSTLIREFAAQLAQIPLWLFEESYHIVGDLAETIALVVPQSTQTSTKSLTQFITEIIALKPKTEAEKKEYLIENWTQLNYYERFVFTKLITGGFRIGVSQKLMTRALAKATEIDEETLAYKLMGNWNPNSITFSELVLEHNYKAELSKPYPFYLAYPVEDEVVNKAEVEDFYFEHKWDGIRAQLIVREEQLFVWSRGEELVTHQFPEFEIFAKHLPNGSVLDGEILAYPNQSIGDFKDLQQRINRKTVTKQLLEKVPVIFKAYDILEYHSTDIRSQSYHERRDILDQLYSTTTSNIPCFHLSFLMQFSSWSEAAKERETAREKKSEGLMIKRRSSAYGVGRKKGDWYKWKSDPFTIDAVLTYAMRGHGRRSNLFTDYTFALWDNTKENLVTFAKAYSGLTDAEFKQVDQWIKKNTLDRFGPVRSVTPEHVFEIAFEGIANSKRHKSGVATRFPRIVRWRKDKPITEANTLDDLKALITE